MILGRKSALVSLGLVVALGGLLVFASLALAKPGDLDPSFGTNGLTRTSVPPGFTSGYATAIGKQGRIVVGGENGEGFALARYLPNGNLDPSLAGDGTVANSWGSRTAYIYDVAIGKKGAIFAAGKVCTSQSVCDFAIAKYKSDGELDRSFGQRGKRIVRFSRKNTASASAVAIDSRGRIVLAGTACHAHFLICSMAVARLGPNGRRDHSFANDGRLIARFQGKDGHRMESRADAMAIDSRGQIVVGGSAGAHKAALARFKPNGHPARRFGGDGMVARDLSHLGLIFAIAVDDKDRVVATGTDRSPGTKWALARFGRRGGLDSSFGNHGQVSTRFSKRALGSAVGIDSRNRIVVAGDPLFSLARYRPNGDLDPSFGDGGKVTKDFGSDVALGALAIDSQNRPVAAGSANHEFAVARFLG